MTIAQLGTDELPEIRALLVANGLPVADLGPAVVFLGVRDRLGLEGVVGLERHGDVGLLRSLAVRHDRRRSGLGSSLVAELERRATADGIKNIYLLTTTAEQFFAHRGFARIARAVVPPAIRATAEFASLCPTSSAVMRKPSGDPGPEEAL